MLLLNKVNNLFKLHASIEQLGRNVKVRDANNIDKELETLLR